MLGPVDAMKLKSYATLFSIPNPDSPERAAILERFFSGQRCARTLAQLAGG